MNHFFETQRLLLIPFEQVEATLFHGLSTTPHIRKYLWDDENISLELAQEVLTNNTILFDQKGYGLWKIVLKDGKIPIGYVGLWHFFEESQPQLIYAIKKENTGAGIATEAGRKILRYALETLDFDHLIAAIDQGHQSSINVVEKLGMKFERKEVMEGKPTLFYKIENSG
ncbi:MAG: GNAT family N-acetyltransferase [Bacteroidota bacterium]